VDHNSHKAMYEACQFVFEAAEANGKAPKEKARNHLLAMPPARWNLLAVIQRSYQEKSSPMNV